MGLSQRRRFLIAASTAVVAAPFGLRAQPPRVARIGVLCTLPPSNPIGAPAWKAFYAELKARGWEQGRNLVVEGRYIEGHTEKYPIFAGELVSAGVEVIVTDQSQGVDALRKATRTIPIVMSPVAAPVKAGYVASLAHPGGNITGVSNQANDLSDKLLELRLSIKPDLKKLGVLWSPNNAGSALGFKAGQVGVRTHGIEQVSLPVDAPAELGPALAKAQREGVEWLSVHPTAAIAPGLPQILAWATQHRVMTDSITTGFTRRGLLLSYGPDYKDLWRISATFVDRILRGAKPADLPVEQPTKFVLSINLKAAKAIGVTIPESLLARADEVIQ